MNVMDLISNIPDGRTFTNSTMEAWFNKNRHRAIKSPTPYPRRVIKMFMALVPGADGIPVLVYRYAIHTIPAEADPTKIEGMKKNQTYLYFRSNDSADDFVSKMKGDLIGKINVVNRSQYGANYKKF